MALLDLQGMENHTPSGDLAQSAVSHSCSQSTLSLLICCPMSAMSLIC